MVSAFKAPDLNIAEGYAKCIHTLGLGLCFSSAFPPAYLVTLVALTSIYFAHRFAIVNYMHRAPQMSNQVAFAAIIVLHFYVLVHIIMTSGFLYFHSVTICSKHDCTEYQNDTLTPYLSFALPLWLLSFLCTNRRFRFQNVAGKWTASDQSLPSLSEQRLREQQDGQVGSWSYVTPTLELLMEEFELYKRWREHDKKSELLDGTRYLPDYIHSLQASGSPVSFA